MCHTEMEEEEQDRLPEELDGPPEIVAVAVLNGVQSLLVRTMEQIQKLQQG